MAEFISSVIPFSSETQQQRSTWNSSLDLEHFNTTSATTRRINEAQSLSLKLQELISQPQEELSMNEKNFEVLLSKISKSFEKQNEINKMNFQMNSLNYMAGVANMLQNKKLSSHLELGKKRLFELKLIVDGQCETIQTLQNTLDGLNMEVEEQKIVSEELRKNLEENEQLLKESLEQYRIEIEKHSVLINEQQKITQRLYKTKFNHDFLLDSSFLAAGLWIVNMNLVDYPIRMLTGMIGARHDQRGAYRQVLKLILCFLFVYYSRSQAKFYGIHNSVGSWLLYFQNIGSNLLWPSSLSNVISTSNVNSIENKNE